MTKRFHLTSSFLFLLLQFEKLTCKKTCNIRASESLHDVTPVETWSSKVMGKSIGSSIFSLQYSGFTFFGGQ